MLSETEENYLKAIFHISKVDGETVSTNAIAARLDTTAASVSDMIKKLAEKKLVHHQKYKGVELTDLGKSLAVNLIRKHRLWEVFLVDKLGFSWDSVHDIAEQLEHVKSDNLIEKLDKYLGYPKFDPHGDPIPDEKGNIIQVNLKQVEEFSEGDQVVLMGVSDSSDEFLQYLNKLGLKIGTTITIGEQFPYDNSRKIVFNKKEYFLSKQVLRQLLVRFV